MPGGRDPVQIKVLSAISDVSAAAWDGCAGPENPFVSHGFLYALEESGSATNATGWKPQHLVIEDSGCVVACAPLYLKSHSYGEYVFDWGWADAYERAGGSYFPKLLSAVPFTPVTGRRLLVHPEADPSLADALITGMIQLADEYKVSSLHVNFPTRAEFERLGEGGLLRRTGNQFHWENNDYATFDDFLGELTSRKRKTIRRERREVAEQRVCLRALTGDNIKEHHWDAFFRFHVDTTNRKWGQRYLSREFFSVLPTLMADKVVLIIAEDNGETVGGALNLIGTDTLYGRYWGCSANYNFLHFEACYYRAIDFAIKHGLKRVEAGAQGTHKIQRGYLPTTTYSAHLIADPRFRDAVSNFLEQEALEVEAEMNMLAEHSPYRKSGNS